MKKSRLLSIIREEITKVLRENFRTGDRVVGKSSTGKMVDEGFLNLGDGDGHYPGKEVPKKTSTKKPSRALRDLENTINDIGPGINTKELKRILLGYLNDLKREIGIIK